MLRCTATAVVARARARQAARGATTAPMGTPLQLRGVAHIVYAPSTRIEAAFALHQRRQLLQLGVQLGDVLRRACLSRRVVEAVIAVLLDGIRPVALISPIDHWHLERARPHDRPAELRQLGAILAQVAAPRCARHDQLVPRDEERDDLEALRHTGVAWLSGQPRPLEDREQLPACES